jgi:putative transcriptional regulator
LALSNGAPLPEALRNRLREAREAKGWTQAELADRIGVSRKTVNTVENGVFLPSTVVALKLAGALGCPVEELFYLSG